MSKKTLIVDSSQISLFLECPQQWAYTYRTNIQPTVTQPKEAMMKGTYGHKLLELYYKAKVQGTPFTESIQNAIRYDIDSSTNCCCGHAAEHHSSLTLGANQYSVCRLCSGTPNYLHSFQHSTFPLSQPSRLQIHDKFRQYAMTYMNNDVMPHNEKCVEVGFSEVIYEDSEHLFVLEGKIDLLGSLGMEKVIMDHKFQERTHTLYKKSIQFRNYSFVTGTKLMIINYIRMAKNGDKPFERILVSFSADEHRWWKQELIKIYFSMLAHVESATTAGTLKLSDSHNWNSCKGSWGYECPFTQLCEERDVENIKLIKIKQNFVKREEWRPW